jgi:hypothetical protein
MNRTLTPLLVGATLVALAAPALAAAAPSPQLPEDFTGVVVDLAKDSTVPITLHVDSYTTTDELRTLARALGEKGQRGVAAALAEIKPRGWIRVGDTLGFLVPVIREFETDGGTRVFAILDRPFPIFDQLQGTRSTDFPYGLLQLDLKTDGTSNGQLIAAARALFGDDGKITLESFGTKPYQVIGVVEQASKK